MVWPRRASTEVAGGLAAVMISCEPSLTPSSRIIPRMPLSYFPSSLKERPLVPFVEHGNDHFLPWNLCESWLQARPVFSYLAVSSPAAQSRGLSKPLSTLPGEVENSTTAGKRNQGEQEPRLSGPFPFHPLYQTHFRKPT